MLEKYRWFWIIAAFFSLSLIFHFSIQNIPDLDSFYYIRQAWLYRTDGILNSDFPWISHSVIRLFSSSLWYGFGIFLIPFTYFNDLYFGIKTAGVILTAAVLIIYFLTVNRHKIKGALFWPFLLFFSVPNVLNQLMMTRPQTASIALSPLLLSFLATGSLLGTFITAFGITWIHLNLAWLPILIFLTIAAVQLIAERKINWRGGAAVLGGALLGWILRPNFIGALKLFYIQVFKQIWEKQSGLPLLFGKENYPLGAEALFQNFFPFLVLWALAIVFLIWVVWKKNKFADIGQRIFLWSNLSLSVIFFFLSVVVARRAYDFWVLFGIIFIASCFSYLIPILNFSLQKSFKSFATGLLGISFIFLVFFSGYKAVSAIQSGGYPPNELKEVGLWLKENSEAGDIVFNLHWSHFSPLFFWNQKNYYVGGLDPIFQYEYNQNLYWKFHYLSADLVTKKTCGAIECTREILEDTHQVLVRDFNAKYIVLDKLDNPAVNFFLSNDSRFGKKLETEKELVYLIKR